MSSRKPLLALIALLTCAAPVPSRGQTAPPAGGGKVFLTRDEALALAFPKLAVERTAVALDAKQRARAKELAGTPPARSLVHAYVARSEGALQGVAYFDAHEVRTKREVLMVVVAPSGRVARLEVLAFGEPLDYLPRASWYAQFLGRVLDDELSIKRGIRGVAGATLTGRATTDAVRRCLALHRVLTEAGTFADPPEGEAAGA